MYNVAPGVPVDTGRLGRILLNSSCFLPSPSTRGRLDSGGKGIFHIFASLAAFEQDLIRERTNAGLAATRTSGRAGARRQGVSANASDYGLQAAVFTRDVNRVFQAVRRLDFGGVIINDTPNFRADTMPYGGSRLSGLGREGPRFAIEEMTSIQMVAIRLEG